MNSNKIKNAVENDKQRNAVRLHLSITILEQNSRINERSLYMKDYRCEDYALLHWTVWKECHPQYHREWQRSHSGYSKNHAKQWRIDNRTRARDYAREWRANHKDYFKKYRRRNKRKLRKYWREYKKRIRAERRFMYKHDDKPDS
jgi:hypothetical protein